MNKYQVILEFTTDNPIKFEDLKVVDDDILDGFILFRPKYTEDSIVEIRVPKVKDLIKLI